MGIIKINQLPASTGLTPDDLLLVMDDPANTKITKSISLTKLVQSTNYIKLKTIEAASLVSRGLYLPSNDWTHPPIDDVLYFDDGFPQNNLLYRVDCKVLFTGAPPIAFINEPALGLVHGTHKISKLVTDTTVFSYGDGGGFTGISILAGSAVAQTITSVILPNSSAAPIASDHYEPKFFYTDDLSADGYLVEINFLCRLNTASSHGQSIALRWGSAVATRNTTLQSGYLLLEAVHSNS